MRLHESARRHYVRDRLTDEAVLYAAEHVVHREPLDDEDDPRRWLLLGLGPAGRVLELVILMFDAASDEPLIIHAMRARRVYLDAMQRSLG